MLECSSGDHETDCGCGGDGDKEGVVVVVMVPLSGGPLTFYRCLLPRSTNH